jgi:hypothetical protein
MTDFIRLDEALKLVKLLDTGITPNRKRPNITPQKGEHPLYEFQGAKKGGFNGYEHPITEQVMQILFENGYGRTAVAKTEDSLKMEFNKALNNRDPEWISEMDAPQLDKLAYYMEFCRNKGISTIHTYPERLCDGTFKAMLVRAIELGKYERNTPNPAGSAPAPTGMA